MFLGKRGGRLAVKIVGAWQCRFFGSQKQKFKNEPGHSPSLNQTSPFENAGSLSANAKGYAHVQKKHTSKVNSAHLPKPVVAASLGYSTLACITDSG